MPNEPCKYLSPRHRMGGTYHAWKRPEREKFLFFGISLFLIGFLALILSFILRLFWPAMPQAFFMVGEAAMGLGAAISVILGLVECQDEPPPRP